MRISSGMIFDAGVTAINRQASDLLHLQQQLATGRRILTPADDPVASATALEVTQAADITKQYAKAQDNASAALSIAESQLHSATEIVTQIRTLALYAGNGGLSNTDRQSIATQMRAGFEQMVGIANAKDASGQYIFSGYMGNTTPFAGTVETGVSYFGDDGQRFLQVSPSMQLAVSDSGNNLFNRVSNGNGVFVANYATTNSGTGVINAGSVIDATKWRDTDNSGNLEVRFWVDSAGTIGPANTTYYDLVDVAVNPPVSLFTGGPATEGGVTNTYTHKYEAGQAISFSGLAAPYDDFGINVTITGAPASGDSFSIQTGSSQGVFETLRYLILAVERPVTAGTNDMARLTNDLASAIGNIDQASQNFLTVRSSIGSRMNTADSLKSVNESVSLQYQQVLSNLQDIDYTKTISDLTRTQTQLQAAQQSFVKVSQLSLFNYIS